MRDRREIFKYTGIFIFALLAIFSLSARFFFPTNAEVIWAFTLLLVGIFIIYMRVQQMKKNQDKFIVWWKDYSLIGGIFWLSWIPLLIGDRLVKQNNSVIQNGFALFYLLLCWCIGIYCLVLTLKHLLVNRKQERKID